MKKVKNISNTFLFSFAVLLVVNPATVEELANEVTLSTRVPLSAPISNLIAQVLLG